MSIVNFKPSTPCKAGKAESGMQVCTTALGDEICKGCGRTKQQVDNWLFYSEEKRLRIMAELENAD